MALITVALLKEYLRVEHDADDALLADMLESALAAAAAWLGRPITLEEREVRIEAQSQYGSHYKFARTLFLPTSATPIDSITFIKDVDDEEIQNDCHIDMRIGQITYLQGSEFCNGPYTVSGEFGLEALPEYETRILPALNRALRDIVADDYQRRNPAAESEAEGGGVSVKYRNERYGVTAREDIGIPRVMDALAAWRVIM